MPSHSVSAEPAQVNSQVGSDRALRNLGSNSSFIKPHILVLILGSLYVAVVLMLNHGDPMAFVRVGSTFDPGLGLSPMGYDGQFAYQIARAPPGLQKS